MTIDLDNTYQIAAKDLEAGMVLKLADGNEPAEILSVDQTKTDYVKVVLTEPRRFGKSKFGYSEMNLPREIVLVRYHEN